MKSSPLVQPEGSTGHLNPLAKCRLENLMEASGDKPCTQHSWTDHSSPNPRAKAQSLPHTHHLPFRDGRWDVEDLLASIPADQDHTFFSPRFLPVGAYNARFSQGSTRWRHKISSGYPAGLVEEPVSP